LLDVRAPAEFAKGHAPESRNLPILNDDERHQVGIAYKHNGNERATELGHELVAGATKAERIAGWVDFVRNHPEALITCWRGGQRSEIAQRWLADTGTDVPRVPGGFKALRALTLDLLDMAESDPRTWWIVGGRTGTAKTVTINELPNGIDLEGLARHRGSAFGAYQAPQPTPVTFEIELAYAYAREAASQLVLEDESRTIGRLALPDLWHKRMQRSPLVVTLATLEERVTHIEAEYVTEPLARGVEADALLEQYTEALAKISRRLGGARHTALHEAIRDAFAGRGSHAAWIGTLLEEYYDPMYDHQLAKKEERVEFRGSREEVKAFLTDRAQ
jgi:tRNA 2-selenouridine synthase